ncbi:aspartate carbamoyltransferase [Candidatus Micrarchaeota archaeon]|nr:aspartate carbamoyltransferase [Candidatus Micrarchaeota archaeon]
MIYMNIISMRDLDKKTVESIFSLAEKAEKGKLPERKGILATAFFEPSTRTKLSFQSAAERLGMKVVDFIPEVSSLQKGESFSDTVKMLDNYCDIIAIRHPKEGSARLAARLAKHPVINGGDGGNEHPTQTMIDLYTIKKEKGKLDGLNIVFFGDLKHARTMRSLIYGLGMFGANMILISPKGLEAAPEIVKETKEKFGVEIIEKNEMDFTNADVVYAGRIQEERFADKYEAKKVMEQFRLKLEYLKKAKKDAIVLHPLPRLGEIGPEIDDSGHARYFEEAANAVPIRMAIIQYALEK